MNKKIIVRAALGILILVFSFLFWLTLSGALSDGPDWIAQSVWSLSALLALGVCAGLGFLIENDRIYSYGMPALIIFPVLPFLKPGLATMLALAGAILFFVLAVHHSNFERSLRIKFISGAILHRGLASTITGLSLLVTLFFYLAPYTQSLGDNISVPRPLFNAIAEPAMNFSVQVSLPPGMSAQSLPPEFKKQQEELMDKLYLSVNEQLASAGKSFKKWIPLGFSVSLFFSFKVIGTFLSWLMMLFSWLAFRVLLWSGIVKINKVAVEKEIVEM